MRATGWHSSPALEMDFDCFEVLYLIRRKVITLVALGAHGNNCLISSGLIDLMG